MRLWAFCTVLVVPALAFADDGGNQSVIGGVSAPAGKWPDTVAVMWGTNALNDTACTGTLIAPNLVLTAGHCVIGGAPDHVLVGASKLSQPQEGQTILIQKVMEYPDSQNSIDAGLLVLSDSVKNITPRAISSGWWQLETINGSQVQLVGFGTIDRNGSVPTDSLMEATTTITDVNCTTSSGCNAAAKPDGELGAGGMGIDTCPGDSGGPVYQTTPYGTLLVGITSRGYDSNRYECSEGGIYERPGKIAFWMEQVTGTKLVRGPEPTFPWIWVARGNAAETKIDPNDPKEGAKHSFAITRQPTFATAAVRDDGTVRVCAQNAVGQDTVEVTVTDTSTPGRALAVDIPITIEDGTPADSCDVNDFSEGGGCCDTRRSAGGSIPLALSVLLVLRRRRK